MKSSDKKELRLKDTKDLSKMLSDLGAGLFEARLNKGQNKLKNTRELFHKRKKIAVIRTVLREKELIKND